jgi:hypothetical protein
MGNEGGRKKEARRKKKRPCIVLPVESCIVLPVESYIVRIQSWVDGWMVLCPCIVLPVESYIVWIQSLVDGWMVLCPVRRCEHSMPCQGKKMRNEGGRKKEARRKKKTPVYSLTSHHARMVDDAACYCHDVQIIQSHWGLQGYLPWHRSPAATLLAQDGASTPLCSCMPCGKSIKPFHCLNFASSSTKRRTRQSKRRNNSSRSKRRKPRRRGSGSGRKDKAIIEAFVGAMTVSFDS